MSKISKIPVAITSLKPAEQIIDILQGNAMCYIQNPYASPECITRIDENEFFKAEKTKCAELQLILPSLYINYSENAWTKDYLITYGSKSESVGYKILPPYSDKKILPEKFDKATQKLYVNLGVLNDEKKQIALVEWQICQAYEFAIFSKILKLNISKFKTDVDYVAAIILALGFDEQPEEINGYLDNIKNKNVNIKLRQASNDDEIEEVEEKNYFDIGSILKDYFDEYIKKNKKNLDKKNACLIYFYKNSIVRPITIKPRFQIVQFTVKDDKTGVLKPVECAGFSGKFSVLYDPEKQVNSLKYITKCSNPSVKKGIHPMTIKDFQFKDKLKFSGMLVLTLKPICNIYKANKDNIIRAEAVDWEVKQLTMNKYVSDGEIDDMLISEDDENNDVDESNLQGGNDADEYDLN